MKLEEVVYPVHHFQYQKVMHLRLLGFGEAQIALMLGVERRTITTTYDRRWRLWQRRLRQWRTLPCPICIGGPR